MQEPDVLTIIANSILTKIKNVCRDLRIIPDDPSKHNTLFILYSQLSQASAVSGVTSVMNLANAFMILYSKMRISEIAMNDDILQLTTHMNDLLPKVLKDPLLKDKTIKSAYNNLLDILHFIIQKGDNANAGSDSFDEITMLLQNTFVDEASDLINQLEEIILQLEAAQYDEKMIDSVFRIVHTLKGNSKIFGFEHISELSHQLESIFDNIQHGKLSFSSVVLEATLQCIDHFRQLLEDQFLNSPDVKKHQFAMLHDLKNLTPSDIQVENKKIIGAKKETKGKSMYYLFFKPSEDVLKDGSNPLFYIYDLHEFGQCLPIPVFRNINMDHNYKPKKCYTLWHILLYTHLTEEKIREHFEFLSDTQLLQINNLGSSNLFKDKDFLKAFKDKAGTTEVIKDFDTMGREYSASVNYKCTNRLRKMSSACPDSEGTLSLRVASSKIDKLMNLVNALLASQTELSQVTSEIRNVKLQKLTQGIENIANDLRKTAFSISLITLEKSFLRFQRLVRDVSAHFNKEVDLILEGKDTELDRRIIERITDPVMHILRNSIDHGIENPEERIKKGKSAKGTIRLNAYPSDSHVIIEITDDGSGIDLRKVRSTAIEKGYLNKTDHPSTQELIDMIVSPGFSTSSRISEISGRGIGMDVVYQKIKEIRGELEVETKQDAGTRITIRLPLTISIMESVLVLIGQTYYLIPMVVVSHCEDVDAHTEIDRQQKKISLHSMTYSYIDLRAELNIKDRPPANQKALIIKDKVMPCCLVVDEIIGKYQAVIKPLQENEPKSQYFSAASVLEGGETAYMLDTRKIIRKYLSLNRQSIDLGN